MSTEYYAQTSFHEGVWTSALHNRFDLPEYQNAVKAADNVQITQQGTMRDRPHTVYVADAKATTGIIRLLSFIIDASNAYIIEMGDLYFRFFKGSSQITSGGSPVEVATPYAEADLREVQITKRPASLFLTHQDYEPRELVYVSDTDWRLLTWEMNPPPTYEAGRLSSTTLTLSAVTGSGVTATAGAASFLETDEDRLILEVNGTGAAVITAVTDTTHATVDVIDDFSTTALTSGEWTLAGSPAADLSMDKIGPTGAKVTLDLLREQDNETELTSDGTFSAGQGSWSDLSAPTLESGTITLAGSSTTHLEDSGATFQTNLVEAGHLAYNDTDGGAPVSIESVDSETVCTTASLTAGWGVGESYHVTDTSTATFANGVAVLDGGVNGVAWIQRAVTTVSGRVYRLAFTVATNPLSMVIGTTSQGTDVQSELTYEVGDHSVNFTAASTTTYVQFKNNQDQNATLDDVSVKLLSAEGFRSDDVGRYVRGNSGIVELTGFVDATQMTGIIRKQFASDDDVVSGAWTLEDVSISSTLGWPAAVGFHGGRAWVGGSPSFPLNVWGSVVGNFYSFGRGVNDNDAIEFTLTSNGAAPLRWLLGENDLLSGTELEEYVLSGGAAPITPTNVIVQTPTRTGSEYTQPIRVGNIVLFVARGGRSIREFVFNDTTNSRITDRDILLRAEDLVTSNVVDLTYQLKPYSSLFVVLQDATLLVGLYNRNESLLGWSKWTVGGGVLSVATIPTSTTDRVWAVVERNGANRVEYFDHESGYYDHVLVDGAVVYSGVATTTITGLDHLEGVDVDVLAGGIYLGTYTVSSGTVTLTDSVTEAEVGEAETLTITLLRPGRSNAPTLARTCNHVRLVCYVYNTIGGVFNDVTNPQRQSEVLFGDPDPPYSGEVVIDGDTGDPENLTVTITQAAPLPIELRGVARFVECSDV